MPTKEQVQTSRWRRRSKRSTIDMSLDTEPLPAIQSYRPPLSHTNRLPPVAGREWLFLCSVHAEECRVWDVTRHRTPSGSPDLPLHLSHKPPPGSRGSGWLFLCSLLAE